MMTPEEYRVIERNLIEALAAIKRRPAPQLADLPGKLDAALRDLRAAMRTPTPGVERDNQPPLKRQP